MFEHPDAIEATMIIEIEEEVERVLIVKTRLRLWPAAAEYDEERVSDLVTAAHAFAADKQNGITRVRLVSVQGD